MPSLSDQLALFVATPLAVPGDVCAIVRRGFVDAIATMLAARREPVVRIVERFVAGRRSTVRESSLLLGRGRAASADAALVNGTAAHALDYDDVALGGHPSTVLVPAVLAEAETLDASGARAIEAYLVGYETWAELASREPDAYHQKGWHPTAVLGCVASAAAVAHLHRLPATACQQALGLAASMASGLVAQFGSMAKPLHAGRAAAAGIDAVHLAQAGLTSAVDAIEHPAGYLAALSPRGRVQRGPAAAPLGERLRIRDAGLSIKRYPVCYSAHRTIDGVLALVAQHGIVAEAVRDVRVSIGPTAAAMLRNHEPETALEAKFSLEFAVAAAVVAHGVGLRELDDAVVADERVRGLMAKVRIDIVETQCPIEPVFAYADRVRITLADGNVLDSGDIRFPRGNAMLPLTTGELAAKFDDCVAGIDRQATRTLYRALARLESLASVRSLRMGVAGDDAESSAGGRSTRAASISGRPGRRAVRSANP